MTYMVPVLPPSLTVNGHMSDKQFKEWDERYAAHTDMLVRLFAHNDNSFMTFDQVKMDDKNILLDTGLRLYLMHDNGRQVSEDDLEPYECPKTGRKQDFFMTDKPKKGLDEILRMYRSLTEANKKAKLPAPKTKIICKDKKGKVVWTCDPEDIFRESQADNGR